MSSGTAASSKSADSAGGANKATDGGTIDAKRSFRAFASSLIVAVRQAELVATASGVVDASSSSSSGKIVTREQSDAASKPAKDRLIEALVVVQRQRQSLRRHATFLEGKLRGNVKESEALHCCLRSTPCVVGGRKRKFSILNTHDEGKGSESS
jgi:hypothetical protein